MTDLSRAQKNLGTVPSMNANPTMSVRKAKFGLVQRLYGWRRSSIRAAC